MQETHFSWEFDGVLVPYSYYEEFSNHLRQRREHAVCAGKSFQPRYLVPWCLVTKKGETKELELSIAMAAPSTLAPQDILFSVSHQSKDEAIVSFQRASLPILGSFISLLSSEDLSGDLGCGQRGAGRSSSGHTSATKKVR